MVLGVFKGGARRIYGFLFSGSVPARRRGQLGRVEAEGGGQVGGGLRQRELPHGGPEVQNVACGMARGMEAAEDVLLGVDREGSVLALAVVVNGAGTTQLRREAAQVVPIAELPQDLL